MQAPWPLWRRMLFRVFFIYFALTIAPWTWISSVPWLGGALTPYNTMMDWLVTKANDLVFHVRPVLVPMGGSGDTSFGWANLWFVLSVSFIGMLVWSILQRRKPEYAKLNYWLCLFVRYYVAMVSFSYGIIKLFALQMSFPNYSQLATPLGDFLPMRLSWMFLGYSTPYQVFSGAMEVLAGLLLLYRRTATLGVLVATAVFMNVAVLNLSYDIPVKIYSLQMAACCLFLLANEKDRLLCFFIYNRPADACSIYQRSYQRRWPRLARIVAKTAFIIIAVGLVLSETIGWKKMSDKATAGMVFPAGVYDVVHYIRNNDTVPPLFTDSLRWQNVIFDNKRSGSIATADTAFRRVYNRAYFTYKTDTAKHTFTMLRSLADSNANAIAIMNYKFQDDSTILFHGMRRNDPVSFVLRRSRRHFQLAERQFHWLSEANR